MYQLRIPGVRLPEIWVAETRLDMVAMRGRRLPYISWRGDPVELVKCVLFRFLAEALPGVDWKRALGLTHVRNVRVMRPETDEVGFVSAPRAEGGRRVRRKAEAIDERGEGTACDGSLIEGGDDVEWESVAPTEMVLDVSSSVDLRALQGLGYLPPVVDDVISCVASNAMERISWRDGYSKKLDALTGYSTWDDARSSLIIIDASGSIPWGIAQAMLGLADTLRGECAADVIFTAGTSLFYEEGEELPPPEELRSMLPRSNESAMFNEILRNKISGRSYQNVISFGDNDTPVYAVESIRALVSGGGKVGRLVSFHTHSDTRLTGYSQWVRKAFPQAEVDVRPHSWCSYMGR